jgi:cephalosporin hydroxylase
MANLTKLYDKYGADKGTKKHMYSEVYEAYFYKHKDDPINVLEIGVFKGASVQAHHDYFSSANLYAADIFVRVDPKDIPILNEERVHWIKANSTAPNAADVVKKHWGDIEFDLIIDDGAHDPVSMLATLKNFMPFLKEGGTYFIEDLFPLDKMNEQELKHPWLMREEHKELWTLMNHAALMNEVYKYNVKTFDLRQKAKTRIVDSYMLALEK